MSVPLKQRLIEQIRLNGPMSVADYVHACLHDPIDGYYTKHVRIGAEGDFITAPAVSQVFGELIGLWVIQVWDALGHLPVRLVEIGGGDGTLMSDVLRVLSRQPQADIDVMMIEPSAHLRTIQTQKNPSLHFAASIDALPEDRPLIIIANEVLDCLPARQFARMNGQMFERRVGVDENDNLMFGLSPSDLPLPASVPEGEIVEISTAQQNFAAVLALKLKAATGAALLIDYGRDTAGTGDTLQALYRHEKTDPLAHPGQHDLTQWADFPAVALTGRHHGLGVSAITTQAEFLRTLGIDVRMSVLANANPDKMDVLNRQYMRLMHPDQMGELFKVIGLCYPKDMVLPAMPASE